MENKNKFIDLSKSFGLPLTVVIVMLITTWKLSGQISDFTNQQNARYIELTNKLDNIKAEMVTYNTQTDKKIEDLKVSINAQIQLINLKAKNYILAVQVLNPDLKLPTSVELTDK